MQKWLKDKYKGETNNSVFVQANCVKHSFVLEKWPGESYSSAMPVWYLGDSPETALRADVKQGSPIQCTLRFSVKFCFLFYLHDLPSMAA